MSQHNDLTIIMLTANKLPAQWVAFHKEKLLKAAGDAPIITLSREPMDWGVNILQTEDYGISNIYFQLLKGANAAKTSFIAVAEDDTLYPTEHFLFRPPRDTFCYNMNKFGVFTWGKPTFFWKNRFKNSTLIASRELVIEALTERFKKHPNGTPGGYTGELGRNNIEDKLGVTRRKADWFTTEASVIAVDHEFGIDRLARTHRKGMGILRAYEIPYWGKASDIVSYFK